MNDVDKKRLGKFFELATHSSQRGLYESTQDRIDGALQYVKSVDHTQEELELVKESGQILVKKAYQVRIGYDFDLGEERARQGDTAGARKFANQIRQSVRGYNTLHSESKIEMPQERIKKMIFDSESTKMVNKAKKIFEEIDGLMDKAKEGYVEEVEGALEFAEASLEFPKIDYSEGYLVEEDRQLLIRELTSEKKLFKRKSKEILDIAYQAGVTKQIYDARSLEEIGMPQAAEDARNKSILYAKHLEFSEADMKLLHEKLEKTKRVQVIK